MGYRVFNDVAGESGKKAFNLDHVVVGPTGVTVVETKTRRKANSRTGHEVSFNGEALVWPWGEDRHGIQQTCNNADWLQKWLHERTGLKIPVNRVLTLPGWYVRETPSPALRVVNTKWLPDVIQRFGGTLTPEQVDLISRQLDERCRDVED